METKNKPDNFFNKESKWQTALLQLRQIILEFPFEETIKWGSPVYTFKGKNVVGLAGFKNHFGLWFFQGVFLSDKEKVLINAQEGTTKALRQWRFENESDLLSVKDLIKDYILEAIENAKQGKQIKIERNLHFEIPAELQAILNKDVSLLNSFNKLTLNKQKDYAFYVDEAKRASTKKSRLEKCIPLILKGKGLNDQYKNC